MPSEQDPGFGATLRTVFGLSPTILCLTGLEDGRVRDVNDSFLHTSGFTREEVIGRPMAELGLWLNPEDRVEGVRALRAGQPIRGMEARFRMKNGEERVTVLAADVVTIGGEACILTALTDITDRTRLEAESRVRRDEAEALAHSLRQANRAKDEFLAMLGHELRNPLGTLTNAVAVLDKMTAGDETMRHLLAIVSRQTGHLARLVDDLLDVGRVTTGKIELHMQPVELRALVGRCLDGLVQAGRTQRHTVTLQGVDLHVEADVTRLEQIVNNLLDNALKYTPASGCVTVVTAEEDGQAVLRVRDTGNGIAADLLSRVFDLFVQEPQALDRSRGGLGIGLALVKRLVDLHGGTVSVWSAGPGQGSEFTVRLPLREQPAAASTAASRAVAPAVPPRRRVLVVEDSADARQSLQMLLELAGHVVETSEDGPSGLAKLDQFRPEVALIDLGLPGIDGYTLARMARDNPETRAIRLVAVTGYGQAEDRQRALAAGFDLHVTKPVDASMLEEMLGRPR
jgi:PAS domain S-box-containing protein